MRRRDLQDHLAHRDRLDEQTVGDVAVDRALERLDRRRGVPHAAIRLADALGPRRRLRLDLLELGVEAERHVVLASRDRGLRLLSQAMGIPARHP